MKPRQRTLASFTAVLGLITLILAVSILVEKAHENHLPERNGRSTQGALIAYGLPAGILLLLSAFAGSGKHLHSNRTPPGTRSPGSESYCSFRNTGFAMEWPMRMPPRFMPAH